MNKDYINTITKYFYEWITKIKIKKSKEDSRKLKELELALSKAEEEKEIAYNKYSKLLDKTIRISDSITKIENNIEIKNHENMERVMDNLLPKF